MQPSPFIVPHCHEQVEILWQDEHYLAVSKPSGLLTVPGRDPRNSDSVLTRLQAEFPNTTIVHRLDMDTSGLLLIALSAAATSAAGKLFEQRKIAKRYEAVVDGLVVADSGDIKAPLITDWPNRPLQKICTESGKPSHTEYCVLERLESTTRVELTPHTGRSHQLRIHLREAGHPILGDAFYAPDAVCEASPRLLLHATKLAFSHPLTHEPLQLECPASF